MNNIIFVLLFLINFFLYSDLKPKLTFIWDENPSFQFQYDWLTYLTSDFELVESLDPSFESIEDGSIIIISKPLILPQSIALKSANNKGIRFGIIHLCDEAYLTDLDFYNYASIVYREYYHPIVEQTPHISCIPLGCKKGFQICKSYNELPDISQRKYSWSFLGQINKNNRKIMFEEMTSLNLPSYWHFNTCFNSFDCLSTKDYQNIMEQTLFAPCPCGWVNLDCYRLYESLESGCIPIVERGLDDYFYKLYTNPPFIICKTWADAPKIITYLLNHPDELEELRKNCFDWWANYKIELKNKIFNELSEAFSLINSNIL